MRNILKGSSSEEEHMENALALGADEGRDKLRKATGRSKYPASRGCPNVGTHVMKNHVTYTESIGICGEPRELKHLSTGRKRNQTRFRE